MFLDKFLSERRYVLKSSIRRPDFPESILFQYPVPVAIVKLLCEEVLRIADFIVHYFSVFLYRYDIRVHESAVRLQTEGLVSFLDLLVELRVNIDTVA